MTTDYCTADELREWIGITDGDEAGMLASAVTVASRMIDNYCSTFFYLTASQARTFTPTTCERLDVPPIASTSGLAVTVDAYGTGSYSETYTSGTHFVLKPDGGYDGNGRAVPYDRLQTLPFYSFPIYDRPSVQITALWGWATVPDEVKQACLMQSARIFRRRLTPEGFSAGEAFGAIRVSSRMDPDVAMLLTPFRSVGAMIA